MGQQSPTVLVPGTSFVKDNFSIGGGGGAQLVTQGMREQDEASIARCSLPAVRSSCGLVQVSGPGVGDTCCGEDPSATGGIKKSGKKKVSCFLCLGQQ